MQNAKTSGKKKLLSDLLLILSLLLLSGAFLLCFSLFSKSGDAVRVTVDGNVVGEYSLSVNMTVSLCGGGNLLVIEDGTARIENATCPDILCEKQGRISRVGEKLICLPHKLTVEVVGRKKAGDPDLVAFRPLGTPYAKAALRALVLKGGADG